MKETRSQKRMSLCWRRVKDLIEGDQALGRKVQKAYHSALKKAVSHIYTHGLEMAMLFLFSRGTTATKRAYKDLSLCCQEMLGLPADGDLLSYLQEQTDRKALIRATEEVVAIVGMTSYLLRGKDILPDVGDDDAQPEDDAETAAAEQLGG